MHQKKKLANASKGLGYRREIATDLLGLNNRDIDFFEVAPENWIGVGGEYSHQLRAISERFPLTLHGLSLNIGGFSPLDMELLAAIKAFIHQHQCPIYSEHLSYCGDAGHLYDLMPIPFREDAIASVVERINIVQDTLGEQIALENVSYYATVEPEMSEFEFICEVLTRADCMMLLDVNNVYVNSINHCYDPCAFLQALPVDRVQYLHIAGHYVEDADLLVDTHGSAVCDPVWQLLDDTYQIFGLKPTLLERDFNFPPVQQLLGEINTIGQAQVNSNRTARPCSAG